MGGGVAMAGEGERIRHASPGHGPGVASGSTDTPTDKCGTAARTSAARTPPGAVGAFGASCSGDRTGVGWCGALAGLDQRTSATTFSIPRLAGTDKADRSRAWADRPSVQQTADSFSCNRRRPRIARAETARARVRDAFNDSGRSRRTPSPFA